jgi:hypothetical protein
MSCLFYEVGLSTQCPRTQHLWGNSRLHIPLYYLGRLYALVAETLNFELLVTGLLDDLGGQGSSPKDFTCRLDLDYGLGLRPRKEKSRFYCFWTSQWAFENPTFSPVVHRGSWPADGQKSISLSIL